MAKYILTLLLLVPVLSTCSHRWIAYPQQVKEYEKCQGLNSNPQMLKIPGYDRSYIMVHECGTMDRQRVSIAITIFLEEWRKIHKPDSSYQKVKRTMNNLLVEFSNVDKFVNGYDVSGTYITNVSVSGLAQGPTMAWVKSKPGDLLCKTSFTHEMMHLAIWALKGTDGDPDHLGKKYIGWSSSSMIIIQNTNTRLCTLGI